MNSAIQVIDPRRGERPNLVSITALELSIHRWRSRLFRRFGRGAVPGAIRNDMEHSNIIDQGETASFTCLSFGCSNLPSRENVMEVVINTMQGSVEGAIASCLLIAYPASLHCASTQ